MPERNLRQMAREVKTAAGMAEKAGLLSGKNSRMGNGLAITLVLIAGIADAFSLIPFVGDFVGPAFWICMSIFLWMRGFGFLHFGRLATKIISTVAELIPVVQAFPTIIAGMVLVILLIRFEDRTGKSIIKPLSTGGMRGAPGNLDVRALNSGGRREPRLEEDENNPLAA